MVRRAKHGIRAHLLAGSITALMLAGPAFAQPTPVKGEAPQDGAQKGKPADDATDRAEIVVTAERRAENLQNVPISIAVLQGAALDKSQATGLTEALRAVPGIAINETYQGGGTQVSLRGVSAGGALFSGSSPVSYYIDSIPFGLIKNAIGPDLNAYDLDRVEVVRGPQGTLYGANSQNGVVRVLTHAADLNNFDFKARASVSDTDGGAESYRGDAAVNLPIIDGRLAARVVYGY
jgi:outer membrane receptor protein involved in Fe transport